MIDHAAPCDVQTTGTCTCPFRTYTKHPTADAYSTGGTVYTPYAYLARDKRLTDAELAAEVHAADLTCWVRKARCDNYPGEDHLWDHYERGIDQHWTLQRFATLPHYDQEDA